MPDDLFSSLLDDLEVRPLPPAEVRRRGDRLRRRRAALSVGGAGLAVALVAVPVSVLASGGDDATPPLQTPTSSSTSSPTTTPSTGSAPAGPDAIPAEFPLDVDLGGDASSGSATSGPRVTGVRLRVCGRGGWGSGSTSRLAVNATFDSTLETRELRVYPTESDAAAVVTALRGVTTTCTTDQTGDGPYTVTPVDARVGDDAVTWVYADASGRPGGDIVQVVRVGRAVLATRDSSEWTATSGAAYVPQRTEVGRTIAEAMCAWSAAGCGSASTSPPRQVDANFVDLPLAVGLAGRTEGTPLDGPSATAQGAGEGPCPDTSIWPTTSSPTPARWAVSALGPEYRDSREVRVFATAQEAVGMLASARGTVTNCGAQGPQGESGRVVRGVSADTGYDSVTWVVGYEGSLGGEVHQVTRVGRAVLATVSGSETTLDAVADGVPARTDLTRQLAAYLCTFTAAGC